MIYDVIITKSILFIKIKSMRQIKTLFLLWLTLISISCFADVYPNRPIKIIVPFPPGGGVDSVARAISDKLATELGQPVLVDNRAGSGGSIGTSLVSHATPDGYTLLLAPNGHTVLSSVQKTDWDPVKDFIPLVQLLTFPMVILVNANSKIKTYADLVSEAKARPGQLSYGSSGIGGPIHIGMELFKSAAGLNILHIPYKGNAPLTVALLSEEVSLSMDTLAISLTQIKQGKFRAIAVTGAKRHPLLPDVPTLAESGLKGFQYEGWQGVFAPAKTSSVITDQLIQAIKKISSMPAVIHRIYELGYEPVNISQEDFVKVISSEVLKYSKFVKDSKIQAE